MQVYLHITPTVQTLHYCPAGAWRWNDVVLTYMWRHDVKSMSFWRHVPAGCAQDRCVKSCPTSKMKSTVFRMVYFLQNLDTSYSFPYLLSLIICERSGKKIARTLSFMHQSFFRPNYIFNNDGYFLDFRAQKFLLIFVHVNPFKHQQALHFGFWIMKNNIKKAPVKFWEDLQHFQHFMLIFCLCPN